MFASIYSEYTKMVFWSDLSDLFPEVTLQIEYGYILVKAHLLLSVTVGNSAIISSACTIITM